MDKKIECSVYIITYNEEKNIRRALQSVKNFKQIVIVDSFSSDLTLQIAQEFDVEIYQKEWSGFTKQKSYALSLCKMPWVLNIDADEEVSSELEQEIREFIQNPSNITFIG